MLSVLMANTALSVREATKKLKVILNASSFLDDFRCLRTLFHDFKWFVRFSNPCTLNLPGSQAHLYYPALFTPGSAPRYHRYLPHGDTRPG